MKRLMLFAAILLAVGCGNDRTAKPATTATAAGPQLTLNVTVIPGNGQEGTVLVGAGPIGEMNCSSGCQIIGNSSLGEITLVAFPNPGFTFIGWSGCEVQADPTRCLIIALNANRTVFATFG